MTKFGLAVHEWAHASYSVSGPGGVVIHLSEKALAHSSGAPLSFVSQVPKPQTPNPKPQTLNPEP